MDREQYAYGQGWVECLIKIADDLHNQAHMELEKNGSGDARGVAFFETYQVLKQEAVNVKAALDQQYLEENTEHGV